MWRKNMFKRFSGYVMVFILSLCFVGTSQANLSIIRTYKKTFHGKKIKCITCHIDKSPKEEEGRHEHNAYGEKILEVKKELNKKEVDSEVLEKVEKDIAADKEKEMKAAASEKNIIGETTDEKINQQQKITPD